MVRDNDRLQWVVKHKNNFKDEIDFLETVLLDNGVQQKDIKAFLRPTSGYINDPKLMPNMEKACELVRKNIKDNKKIFIKTDCD